LPCRWKGLETAHVSASYGTTSENPPSQKHAEADGPSTPRTVWAQTPLVDPLQSCLVERGTIAHHINVREGEAHRESHAKGSAPGLEIRGESRAHIELRGKLLLSITRKKFGFCIYIYINFYVFSFILFHLFVVYHLF
jgi:hypothetical protein